jgi:hypothetical protein
MKKRFSLLFLLSILQQSSWGQEQHYSLWHTTKQTACESIQDLSLELFTNIETQSINPEILMDQRVCVDDKGWSIVREIKGTRYLPSFSESHYPLDIQIIPSAIPYNIHILANYTAVPLLESNHNIHHSILYKGIVMNSTALTVLIPQEIAGDSKQKVSPLKSIGLSLWPTQIQAQSTFMSGTWSMEAGLDPFLTTKGNYLYIDPSVKLQSPNGLKFAIDLNTGSIESSVGTVKLT